jgi:hypothetical protein
VIFGHVSRATGLLVIFAVVTAAVLGVVSLAPWFAYRTGRFVLARAASPALTLAASRVVADPRPVGRAAAAVGGIALVAGGAGGLADEVVWRDSDPFFRISLLLVGVVLLVALLMVVGSLAVHSAESLLDRKRSMAALAVFGASTDELEQAQFAEIMLAAIPAATVGSLLGSATLSIPTLASPLTVGIQAGTVAVTLGLVWLAAVVAVRLTRPWVRQAIAVDNIRTA